MISKYKWKTHDEWIELRKAYIGGSEAGSIIGMNPYKSAYTLWAEKTGRALPFEGNITTEVGAYLEEFVAKNLSTKRGKKSEEKISCSSTISTRGQKLMLTEWWLAKKHCLKSRLQTASPT